MLAAPMADTRLTRTLLILMLVAALATAPLFLFAEGEGRGSVPRVLASNGVAALLCAALLRLLRTGRVVLVARLLVLGLFALVTGLAGTSGEAVHVNVVNFVLVTVLCSVLLRRTALVLVALASATAMCLIAWRQAVPASGAPAEERLFAIAQFLPSYAVIVLVLWLAPRRSGLT